MSNLPEKALLAKLSISQWTARKFDRNATASTINHYNAEREAGRFHKQLVSKSSLKDISQTVNLARKYFYQNTLPWSDEGWRILPTKHHMEFMAKMREYENRFESDVRVFLDDYSSEIVDAQLRLGGMFNHADYPAASKIGEKFRIGTMLAPIPEENDIRVNLGTAEIDRIRNQVTSRVKQAEEAATADLYGRMTEVLRNMVDRLTADKPIFRDTLVTNITELVELIPKLNVTMDARIEKMRRQIKAALEGIDPQNLREDDGLRKKAAESAEEIMKKMKGLF